MAIWGNRDAEPSAENEAADVERESGSPAEAPAVSESPARADAPAPVVADDVVVLDAEAAVTEPAPAGAAHDPAAAPGPSGGIAPQRWSEILAAFVDDPRGSVKMAADAVDSAIEEIVTSVRAQQQALATSWQDSGADTEKLRMALLEYRRFGAQVHRMNPPEATGRGTAAAS